MFDQPRELYALEIKSEGKTQVLTGASSFKNIRKVRKNIRLKQQLEKADARRQRKLSLSGLEKSSPGPTKETMAKLTPDPLALFRKKNILNDEQIWAFQRIRRAVHIITEGTQVRTSRFNDVVVQSSRFSGQYESEFEVRLKEHYTRWIDRMTEVRQQAGPVLDIIIDEMSLKAVDRKWGKRNGWGRGQLQTSLDLYRFFLTPIDRSI